MAKGENYHKIYVTLGASNHVKEERQTEDFYATDPKSIDLLLAEEKFNDVLEPACGLGHMSERLKQHGYRVLSTDIIDRGYGSQKDFFDIKEWNGDIITNPPYNIALPFAQHALEIIPDGNKVAMFLKLLFLEGKARKEFFMQNPPKTVYVCSGRVACCKNGDFATYGKAASAVAYAWFVWQKGYKGSPEIKWIN